MRIVLERAKADRAVSGGWSGGCINPAPESGSVLRNGSGKHRKRMSGPDEIENILIEAFSMGL